MPQLPWFPRRDDLIAQLRRASELAQEGNNEQALEVARGVEAACVALKIESSHVAWALAVLEDTSGNLGAALEHILKAVRIDPVCVIFESSLNIIVKRVRKKLVEGAWDEGSDLPLYMALADSGLANDACRIAYAEFLHGKGQHAESLQVAQAVALLNPALPDAWRIVGAAARALGDEALAEEAAGRCMSARCASGPAPLPNVSWGQA